MKDNTPGLSLMLKQLCLGSLRTQYQSLADRAAAESWSYSRYLQALCEIELGERHSRRIERLLKQSRLPAGKSVESLDQKLLPEPVRRQLSILLEGRFVDRAENVLVFGLPGRGKTHLVCAIARELIIQQERTVYFSSTFHLVQQMLVAKRDLTLEALLRKLDRYDIVILDDIGYVQQSAGEMEVLFTFLAERYERRSLMITSNLVFSQWDRIFKDAMTTAAAIDRLVHHSIVLELSNESFRMKSAEARLEKS
jgi:DNA replication protein DnaC